MTLNRDNLSSASITGSVMQDDWNNLKQQKQSIFKIKDSLYTEMYKVERAGNTPKNHAAHVVLANKIYQCGENEKQFDYKFIQSNPGSYLSPYLTKYYFSGIQKLSRNAAEKFYNSFIPVVKNSIAGRLLKKELANKPQTFIDQ